MTDNIYSFRSALTHTHRNPIDGDHARHRRLGPVAAQQAAALQPGHLQPDGRLDVAQLPVAADAADAAGRGRRRRPRRRRTGRRRLRGPPVRGAQRLLLLAAGHAGRPDPVHAAELDAVGQPESVPEAGAPDDAVLCQQLVRGEHPARVGGRRQAGVHVSRQRRGSGELHDVQSVCLLGSS